METMLGFDLDFWDYLTFATVALASIAVLLTFIWFAGLPGRIAAARDHPEAEAVNLLGWAGVLPTIYPWVQAFIWAFKPTDVIDVRRLPREEAAALARARALRSRKSKPSSTAVSSKPRRVGH